MPRKLVNVNEGILCCPHCGGKSGFSTSIYYKASQYREWNGTVVDTDAFDILKESSPKCADCGKSVRTVMEQTK